MKPLYDTMAHNNYLHYTIKDYDQGVSVGAWVYVFIKTNKQTNIDVGNDVIERRMVGACYDFSVW